MNENQLRKIRLAYFNREYENTANLFLYRHDLFNQYRYAEKTWNGQRLTLTTATSLFVSNTHANRNGLVAKPQAIFRQRLWLTFQVTSVPISSQQQISPSN